MNYNRNVNTESIKFMADSRYCNRQLSYVHLRSSYIGWFAWCKRYKVSCAVMDGDLKRHQ